MLRNLTPTLLLAVLAVSCAKEKAYETKYKEPEMLKRSQIKTHRLVVDKDGKKQQEAIEYMYVPMSLGTPMEVVAASPFEQGDEKVVRLKWTEEGLSVVEFEKDERFNENGLNDVPVLMIPGEYVGYRCAEDDFGDCTNAEEEIDDAVWSDKGNFTPDFAEIDVQEVNMLDAGNIEGNQCTSKIATNVVDYEISDGVINVELEKTYQVDNDWRCLWRQYVENKFPYNSFKVRFFYSLVQLDKLTTPGYQAIDYPAADHDEFGFFETETNTLEDHFDPTRKIKKHMVNRWAPNRKNGELVYHLSKNLSKPENKILLDATYQAVDIMNVGLTAANSPFKIVVKEQALDEKEVSPGDLRYNTIVLIEDPLANGLLGYGPSVKNPYTGEIVQAHTNMYGGVLKRIVRRVYESAVDLTESELKKSNEVLTDITVADSAFAGIPSFMTKINNTPIVTSPAQQNQAAQGEQAHSHEEHVQNMGSLAVVNSDLKLSELSTEQVSAMISQVSPRQLEILKQPKVSLTDYKSELSQMMNGEFGQMDELDIINFKADKKEYGLGLTHKHKPEFFPIGGTTKKVYPELLEISGIMTSKGSLKRWESLNEVQKQDALKIILTKSWISTLVHEIGHNLGLRHNFGGSHDKDNFYTAEEASELGYDEVPAYSSVMDYSYSKYNQLRSFGKYDIAALRFAYAREVEVEMVKNNLTSTKSLESTDVLKTEVVKLDEINNLSIKGLKESLEAKNAILESSDEVSETGITQLRFRVKPYGFCTDGHKGLSSTCNVFDEGTSLTEIAKFRVEDYNRMYKYRNFRDGRVDFSAYDVASYVGRKNAEFGQIRDIFEEVERYTQFWDIALITQGCGEADIKSYPQQCGMINDAKGALETISKHFIDILKTPDHLCAVAKKDAPTQIVEYKTLYDLNNVWYLKFDKGDVLTSCFDPVAKEALAKDDLIVVGEAGKFLNGFKGANSDYKYVTDRAVLGTWPDKVLAMKFLFKRRWRNGTTDTDHMALVDIPSVNAQVIDILAHYIMGMKLNDPVAFTTESGATFKVPYIVGSNYKIEQVEDYLGSLKKYFVMPQSGKSNLVTIALNQISKVGVNYGEDGKDAAHNAINIAAVRRFNSTGSEDLESFSAIDIGDYTYAAGDNTPVAQHMITSIIAKKTLDAVDKEVLEKVVLQRMNPSAPSDLSPEELAYFSLDDTWQVTLIDLKTAGNVFTEDQFKGQFGEEAGVPLFKIYTAGVTVMTKVREIKLAIVNTVPAEASADEKLAYQFELQELQAYLKGEMSQDQVDFYTKQLSRLPNYVTESLF